LADESTSVIGWKVDKVNVTTPMIGQVLNVCSNVYTSAVWVEVYDAG